MTINVPSDHIGVTDRLFDVKNVIEILSDTAIYYSYRSKLCKIFVELLKKTIRRVVSLLLIASEVLDKLCFYIQGPIMSTMLKPSMVTLLVVCWGKLSVDVVVLKG